MISSNNQFAVGFNFPLALTPGDAFGVKMTYTASNQTLATVMTQNGQPFGPIKDVALEPGELALQLAGVELVVPADPRLHVVGPQGLSLEEVRYPADEELAERAVLTRRVRELPRRGHTE